MKAESEVSIFFALSIFSNEKFKADDDRLNYQSYKELGLICGQCRELVFFKQGIERVSHFSHFRDTGKDCPWRTESHSNTQSSDSFKREQSLQEFQTNFRWIIEQGIIKHQQISDSQLREQIKEGQKLVSTYKIDIESSLRWFNQNREQLGNLAKSLYQSNELVSEENQIILLNFVDYLCVPASEDILRDILYYVFCLLDKEICLNKYLEEVCSKVIELMSYVEWEKEYKPAKELVDTSKFEQNAHQEKVEWQTPKPLALTGANVSPINAMIKAILVNCPSLITLRPSGDKWKISVLPVRVSNYHLAIYLSDKLGLKDLTDYLNSSMQFLAPDAEEYKQLQILKDRILSNQAIGKDEVLTSTNILKATLHKETMLSHKLSYTDHYYRPFTLGYVTRIEEIERELPSYTLTVWGNEKDTRRTDTPIVINWLKRLPYLLSNHFQAELPTFNEVRGYLQSSFKFKNVELIVKNGHSEGVGKHKRVYPGIFLEVYYQDVLQTRQLLNITTPVTDSRKGGKVPVKVSHTIDVNYPRELAKLLKCQLTDDHLIKQAMAELTKIANKFISSNYTHFLSPNKTAMTTSNREIRGFDKTSKCFSQVVKTFNKFSLPFTQESEVNKGKLLDLSTLETYDKHKIASLLESLVTGWKYWSKADDEKIELGNELFHKPDPGKLMLVVHNLLNDKPHLDSLVWGDLVNVFYQISGLNVGFRTNTGVVLTPFDIYSSGIERWEHRIKVQLISIIKEGDKTRTLGIESLLQRDIYSLYSLLNRLQPGWNNNEDINKHLQALHDTLAAEGDNEAIPEIPDTVEETQNHLESSSEVLEVNPEITQPIDTTGEVSQVLEVIPKNVEEITDPISHSSEVIEVREETAQPITFGVAKAVETIKEVSQVLEVTEFSAVVNADLLGDFFSDDFEQDAHSDFVNSPVEVKGFVHPNINPKTSIRNDDGSIAISKEVKTLLTPKAQLTNLSNAKSVAKNSLEWCGMIAHIPCKVTLVNSHNHWQLQALPIRDIPSYPLFYTLANKAIEDKWQEEEVFNVLISPIDKELKRLNELASKSEDPEMIQKIGLRESKLEKLKAVVLSEKKLNPKTLSECSEIVKQAIEKADYKPSPIDPYYSRYILAQVYFLQTNEDKITYLLDDYMSHKRTASEVQTAINFLKLVPRNLDKKFPDKRPTLKELQEFIIPLFRSKFGGQSRGSLELKVREERGKILIDVIYQDKIQLTQLLTIKMPATEGKNCGKVTTKVAPSLDFESRAVFEKFLRTKDGRFATQAMNQLKPLVQSFLSKNFSTLVGENKIGKSDKLTGIIGFNRSRQGWGQIKRGFIKYMIPFSSISNVKKGKLVWLNSNKVLNAQDLENLIIKIAENWKNWHRKDQEYIKLGDTQVKNTDPQNLMFMLTKLLTEKPNIEEIVWKDTLDWFCEIVHLPIGFRASNGVILTPDAMYGSHVEKWEHRIKIQLVDLLLESQAGSIEGWLKQSISQLYNASERLELTLSKDVKKHLEAMHEALDISLKVEESKL